MDRLIDKTKGVPVNRTAALVTQQPKYGYDETKHIDPRRVHSALPLPLRPVPRHTMPAGSDLTGCHSGRLTVQGIFDHRAFGREDAQQNKRGAQWVVRCDCGRFETRRRKALLNETNREDRCEACWKLARLKRHRHYLDGELQRADWEY